MSQDTSRRRQIEAGPAAAAGDRWWSGHARQLGLLIAAQALYLCSMSVDLTLSGLVGYELAPNPDLATLPFGLITVGSASATGFVSALMARRGRRAGFLLGTTLATVGGVLSVCAILEHSFPLFCSGALCVGVYQGCAGYYRYTAADQVPAEFRARAISTVLTGGIIAAVAGPFVATALMNITSHPYEGSYPLVSVLSLIAMAVVSRIRAAGSAPARTGGVQEAGPAGPAAAAERRLSLPEIARQPGFAVGAFAAATGYIAMMIVMTVGPIAGMQHGLGPQQRSLMIQLHMVGMYAPALAAGFLIRRIGVRRLQLLGAAAGVTGVAVGASGTGETEFVLALALVGVAWSLLYISGSSMIALSYAPKDKARTQALGEALIMSGSAVGGLSAATLLTDLGWTRLNVLILVLLAAAGLFTAVRPAGRTVADAA